VFISSDMDEILEISDRIIVMAAGAVVTQLDPRKTSKQEIMRYGSRVMQGEG
jgi:ABC-type sugar transport system ATPase subunit